MNNISSGSVPTQMECVRGIPVMVITGRLDATKSPAFNACSIPTLTGKPL